MESLQHWTHIEDMNLPSEFVLVLVLDLLTQGRIRGREHLAEERFRRRHHGFKIAHQGQEPGITTFCCICNKRLHRCRGRFMGSFDFPHWTRIVAMNRLAEVGRVTPCAPSLAAGKPGCSRRRAEDCSPYLSVHGQRLKGAHRRARGRWRSPPTPASGRSPRRNCGPGLPR